MLREIGRGSFGTVVMCQDRSTETIVAIKVLHKDEDLHPDIDHEARMYRKLLAGCDRRSQYVENLLFLLCLSH